MVGDLHIRIANLAFHAKESPIRTRDEVFNLVSSYHGVRPMMIVRLSGHPLVQDSLTLPGEDPSEHEVSYLKSSGADVVAVVLS